MTAPNGHGATWGAATDLVAGPALERALAMAVVADPSLLCVAWGTAGWAVDRHADPFARAVLTAVVNLDARGARIDRDAVEAELAASWADVTWFAGMVSVPSSPPLDAFVEWTRSVVDSAHARAAIVDAETEAARRVLFDDGEAEIDEFALRDAEPTGKHDDVVHPARWEWAPPLEQFLGDGEPDDDDTEDWIIRDLIPRGEPFLFGGAWKSGKTWTALALAASISLGLPFLGFENCLGRPGRVLLLALEDGKRRLRKRVWQILRGMGLTPNNATIREYLRIWDNPIRIPGDSRTLKRFVDEMNRWKADVIIIDSLTRAMTGSQNDIRDATAFTTAWRDITIATGAASGFLHHTNKTKPQNGKNDAKADPFDNMRGSGELLAAPRNLIVMERFGEQDSKLSCVSIRGNLELRRASFALEYIQEERDGKTLVTLHDRGDVDELRAKQTEQNKAKQEIKKQKDDDRKVAAALKTSRDRGSCSASTLSTILSVSRATAARYLADMAERGLLGTPGQDGYPITADGHLWLDERKL
jgi:AAA domain-containing protein